MRRSVPVRHVTSRLCLALGAAAAVLMPIAAQAQAPKYPVKPVRLINPFAAGGPIDIVGRALAQELNKGWGQPVIVDNRPGAGTTIGAGLVAKATPDGYTLLVTSVSTAVSVSMYRNLPFDLNRDLTPVTLVAQSPLVLAVHPEVPVKSVQEFIALARAKPGFVRYGSSGAGGISHLAMELLRSQAKIDSIVHVPYKGGAPAVAATAAGEVQAVFDQPLAIMPHARPGRIRAVAVSSPKRVDAAPDTPTFAEAGMPGFEVNVWSALFTPTGTPAAIVSQVNADVNRILREPEMRERLASLGLAPAGGGVAESGKTVRAEVARWAKVIQDAGIKLE